MLLVLWVVICTRRRVDVAVRTRASEWEEREMKRAAPLDPHQLERAKWQSGKCSGDIGATR